MKARFNSSGHIVLEPETPLERYMLSQWEFKKIAVKCWQANNYNEDYSMTIGPFEPKPDPPAE